MHDDKTVQQFIEQRARGVSYARIQAQLNVSKPTLIAWSRKHQFQIQNLRAIEMESLAEQYLATVQDRVQTLGRRLGRVEEELGKRDIAGLTTPQLYALAHSLRRQIGEATGMTRFSTPVSEIPADEYHDQVQDWQG
jgi:hypothetical protein